MAIRLCPICKSMKLRRKEVQTCGAPECVEQWRSLTATQRGNEIESAAEVAYPYRPRSAPSPTDRPLLSPEEVMDQLKGQQKGISDEEFFARHPEFAPKKEDDKE